MLGVERDLRGNNARLVQVALGMIQDAPAYILSITQNNLRRKSTDVDASSVPVHYEL